MENFINSFSSDVARMAKADVSIEEQRAQLARDRAEINARLIADNTPSDIFRSPKTTEDYNLPVTLYGEPCTWGIAFKAAKEGVVAAFDDAKLRLVTLDVKALTDAEKIERREIQQSINRTCDNFRKSLEKAYAKVEQESALVAAGLSEEQAKAASRNRKLHDAVTQDINAIIKRLQNASPEKLEGFPDGSVITLIGKLQNAVELIK